MRLSIFGIVFVAVTFVLLFCLFPNLHRQRSRTTQEFLLVAKQLQESSNPWLGHGQIALLEKQLANSTQPLEEIKLRFQLAFELLRVGQTQKSIDQYELVQSLAQDRHLPAPPDLMARLGVAYWRLAEVSNCIENHNRDCCVFPLADGGLHKTTDPAARAMKYLLAQLENNPEDLQSRWMLNIAAMALGQYPHGVPADYLIPADSFKSQADIGRFVNVAADLGVDTFNLCGGVIAEDFNGDGLIDIVTSTYDPAGPLTFYENSGGGQFVDRSTESRLASQLGGLNCIAGDYDNDGDMDILVLRGAWLFEDGQIRNSLLRNNGKGVFTDVTDQAGLAKNAFPTQAATWGDFDNDGDLDLYIGNESRLQDRANYPNELYLNNGDGTFKEVARLAGVANDRYCKGVTAGDFDNDGDLDLYVSNIGPNRLYENQGNGKFIDIAEAAGVVEPARRSFATWFFDYDNDGWLDLFVAAYEADVSDVVADYLGLPHDGVSPRLYRNDGNRKFTDVTAQVGMNHPSLPMGANFGDLDNDGWLDLYLTTGDPDYATLTPNVMLRNARGEFFQNVTTSGGFGHLQKGHGVAFADFDQDGDQDIYNQLGGFYPGDAFRNALYQNPGHGNHFLVVALHGVRSNSKGLGARITVTVTGPEGTRNIHRSVGSSSSFGGSPLRQEIGLGNADRIDQLLVYWPTSKIKQVVFDVPLDSTIVITEEFQSLHTRLTRMSVDPSRP